MANSTNDENPTEEDRVVLGRPAEPHKYPWLAALQTRKGKHFCAGSILNNRWILERIIQKKVIFFHFARIEFWARILNTNMFNTKIF